jgi:periplasmic divalent cation tolerance protein
LTGIVSVYCVFGSMEEARRVSRVMVERRLAACANILGGCTSIYRWNADVVEASEVAVIFKSANSTAQALVDSIASEHSYEVPAITVWPVEASLEAYAAWVRSQGEPSG